MKILFAFAAFFVFSLLLAPPVFAQEVTGSSVMGNNGNVSEAGDGHTTREEAEGKAVWEKLQAEGLNCEDLSDGDFAVLGEYFMGQMMGNSHEAMNEMMVRMMGEEGEEQTHVVMGKRLSGCDTSATMPTSGIGFMPMMQVMWGGWSSPLVSNQSSNSMMNFGFMPFSWVGWIFMILWWVLIIVGVVALIKWLVNQPRSTHGYKKSPLEILKRRYAKGEIDRKEFEEKKKDLA